MLDEFNWEGGHGNKCTGPHVNNSFFGYVSVLSSLWQNAWYKQLKKTLILLMISAGSFQGGLPPWAKLHCSGSVWWGGSSPHGGQEAECEGGPGIRHSLQRRALSNLLPPTRLPPLKFPKPPKIAPSAGDPAFSTWSHGGTFDIQTIMIFF
jgi:hypothetical protein